MSSHRRSKLLIGTSNPGKFREISTILGDISYELVSLSAFSNIPEPEEAGGSYAENANLKSSYYAIASGLLTLADDSGLEVSALRGAPGVRSARYAGIGASDEDRRRRLLSEMSALPEPDRKARFVSAVSIADPFNLLYLAEGVCDGLLASEPRGNSGFGYDPLFIPHGYQQTFAELEETIKNQISHRARALILARGFLLTNALHN